MESRTFATLLIAAALTATAACSTAAGSAPASGGRALCENMLPGRTIQAWESVSVRSLWGYQYGGPVAHHPLAGHFGGVRPGQAAAWCWVSDDKDTGSLWGVVPDHGTGRAITISGHGGQPRGVMEHPPYVP